MVACRLDLLGRSSVLRQCEVPISSRFSLREESGKRYWKRFHMFIVLQSIYQLHPVRTVRQGEPEQVTVSSMQDPSVVQNYGSLLEQLVQTTPDGLVPAQVSICKVKFGAILCKTDLFEYVCKKVKNQLQSPFETISL